MDTNSILEFISAISFDSDWIQFQKKNKTQQQVHICALSGYDSIRHLLTELLNGTYYRLRKRVPMINYGLYNR